MADRKTASRGSAQASLDLVQRVVWTATLWAFLGSFSVGLAIYLITRGEIDLQRDQVLGLWIMTGVGGLVVAAGTLVIHRRKPWSPLILLGLLPMIVSAFWVL